LTPDFWIVWASLLIVAKNRFLISLARLPGSNQ